MFKPGDKVVCIDDGIIITSSKLLKRNSTYIVTMYDDHSHGLFLTGMNELFLSKRFIKLKEYRKLKLQKLCSNQEIK